MVAGGAADSTRTSPTTPKRNQGSTSAVTAREAAPSGVKNGSEAGNYNDRGDHHKTIDYIESNLYEDGSTANLLPNIPSSTSATAANHNNGIGGKSSGRAYASPPSL